MSKIFSKFSSFFGKEEEEEKTYKFSLLKDEIEQYLEDNIQEFSTGRYWSITVHVSRDNSDLPKYRKLEQNSYAYLDKIKTALKDEGYETLRNIGLYIQVNEVDPSEVNKESFTFLEFERGKAPIAFKLEVKCRTQRGTFETIETFYPKEGDGEYLVGRMDRGSNLPVHVAIGSRHEDKYPVYKGKRLLSLCSRQAFVLHVQSPTQWFLQTLGQADRLYVKQYNGSKHNASAEELDFDIVKPLSRKYRGCTVNEGDEIRLFFKQEMDNDDTHICIELSRTDKR